MSKIFKKHSFAVMLIMVFMLVSGCAKKPDKSQIVAEVNNYQVTVDDFKEEAAMTIPCAAKDKVIQDIIAKELLLEEAQKMNLDKDKKFMKEIENYWKQTLIKRVIELKGNEFLAVSRVSDDEVKAEYKLMEQESEGKIKPYEQMAGQIRERLRMQKAQGMLDFWINSLEKKAKIKKYPKIIDHIELKTAISQGGGPDEE